MSMQILEDKIIINPANSEVCKANSIATLNLKSSVGEFYIGTDNYREKLKTFLSITTNEVKYLMVDKDKFESYISSLESVSSISYIFLNGFKSFLDTKKKITNLIGELNQDMRIGLSINDRSKYLRIVKDNDGKSFSNILYGLISSICLEKTGEDFKIYPILKNNFLEKICHYLYDGSDEVVQEEEIYTNKDIQFTLKKVPNNIKTFIKPYDIEENENNDGINYVKKAKHDKIVGDTAENMVYRYERKQISDYCKENGIDSERKKKLLKSVKNVSKKKLHYDIQSIDSATGQIKKIEVKGTESNVRTPFYMSRKEKEFLENNEDCIQKYLYRVFNLKEKPGLFICNCPNDLSKFAFNELNYEVSSKNK